MVGFLKLRVIQGRPFDLLIEKFLKVPLRLHDNLNSLKRHRFLVTLLTLGPSPGSLLERLRKHYILSFDSGSLESSVCEEVSHQWLVTETIRSTKSVTFLFMKGTETSQKSDSSVSTNYVSVLTLGPKDCRKHKNSENL